MRYDLICLLSYRPEKGEIAVEERCCYALERADGEKTKTKRSSKNKSSNNNTNSDPQPALIQSETSWSARRKDDVDEYAQFLRRIKGLLNKLTIEKYADLLPQLLDSGISDEKHVVGLMKQVFEKATMQHHFIAMYTTFCSDLNTYLKENGICQEKDSDFRRVLLNQCEQSFTVNLEPSMPEAEELQEAKKKHKMAMLGNMKFVGQLFIHKMIPKKVIFSCARELLTKSTDVTMETLCAFLMEIGPVFDKDDQPTAGQFNEVFTELGALSKRDFCMRTKCLITDVLDMRRSKWQGVILTQAPAGPTSLAEVKKEWSEGSGAKLSSVSLQSKEQFGDHWNMKKSLSDVNVRGGVKKPPLARKTFSSSFSQSTTASTFRRKKSEGDDGPGESLVAGISSSFSFNTPGCMRPGGLLGGNVDSKEDVKRKVLGQHSSSLASIAQCPTPSSSSAASVERRSSRERIQYAELEVEKIIDSRIQHSVSDDVELNPSVDTNNEDNWRIRENYCSKPSESSWVPPSRQSSASDESKLIRTMKSILNKLTIEKYEKLYAQLQDLGFKKVSQIRALTDDLFAKATTQHHFIEMYTKLCVQFNDWWQSTGQDECEDDMDDAANDGKKRNHFRSVLVNKCQDVFGHMSDTQMECDIEDPDERREAESKLKERMLGNVKFIGQLLINNVLKHKVLIHCAQTLFSGKRPECLETLAAFLQTVGPVFDTMSDFKLRKDLDKVFDDVRKLVDEGKQSVRIRTLLVNVLDRRADKWMRNKNDMSGPQSLAEVKQKWSTDHSIKKDKDTPKELDEWQSAKQKKNSTRRKN